MAAEKITQMTIPDLPERIERERKDFESLWLGLSEAQMKIVPGPQLDWSVKDLMAHIAWWEEHTIDRVERLLVGEKVLGYEDDDLDRINLEVYQSNKNRLLEEVVTWFEQGLGKLSEQINRLSKKQLNSKTLFDYGGRSLLDLLIANTFGHYAMHREDLEEFVKQVK